MPKKTKTKDFWEYLKENTGINRSFFASKLGMTSQAFDYAWQERGLSKDEFTAIQLYMKDISWFLLTTSLPEDLLRKGDSSNVSIVGSEKELAAKRRQRVNQLKLLNAEIDALLEEEEAALQS